MVRLQNGLSLDRNREIAAELLRSLPVAAEAQVEPVRSYVLAGRRKVRDARSGLAVTGRTVDAFLDGNIDVFLRRNAVALRRMTTAGLHSGERE